MRVHHVFIEQGDGTPWLNLGDTYTGSGTLLATNDGVRGDRRNASGRGHRLPEKSLVGIPWRVALALQQDGWILRSDIIWHKPNPMPESVNDRPTKAHEYLFLFAKSERYFYDADSIREPHKSTSLWRMDYPWKGPRLRKTGQHFKPTLLCNPRGKNKRSVWTIPVQGFTGNHFSTFPERLIEPCILAGSPRGGVVLDPFVGSGTTIEVSLRLGRRAIGIDLNPAYVPLIEERVERVHLARARGRMSSRGDAAGTIHYESELDKSSGGERL